MPKYAFLVTTDDANIVIPTWRDGVLAFAEGRDQESDSEGTTWFNRYVLLGTEDDCRALVGINGNVPTPIRERLAQDSVFWQLIEFSDTKTKAEMLRRLVQWAGELGFTHGWPIESGQQLVVSPDLLSMFRPLAEVTAVIPARGK